VLKLSSVIFGKLKKPETIKSIGVYKWRNVPINFLVANPFIKLDHEKVSYDSTEHLPEAKIQGLIDTA
jgi:hypothetical protein